jgi:hypothetical protein
MAPPRPLAYPQSSRIYEGHAMATYDDNELEML